jgi:hypothetical protein
MRERAFGHKVGRMEASAAAEARATLGSMDAVRFGRALGFGARQAVKTLTTAVDAATAPDPAAKGTSGTKAGAGSAAPERDAVRWTPEAMRPEGGSGSVKTTAQTAAQNAARTASRTIVGARTAQQGLQRGGRRFGEAAWGPFVRLSGVVWLEVSGVFFGIFALFAGAGVWRLHGAWRATAENAATHRSFEGAVLMLAVFGYFCATSFVRARRRERGR